MPRKNTYTGFNDHLLADLKTAGYRRIALQVPAGLIPRAHEMGMRIEEATGARVFHMNRACFGACDPPSVSEAVGAEAIVTLGHAAISNMREDLPEYYIEMRTDMGDAGRIAELVAPRIPKRVGLVGSIQHMTLLEPLVAELGRRGVTARVGTGGPRLSYPGQALGCNYTTATSIEADVDAFLFVGTGRFHPVGLAFSVKKPVYAVDPQQLALEGPYDRESLVKRRLMTIAKAMDAKRWGVLVSTFPGQMRATMASRLIQKARERGREASLLTFDRLDPRDLTGRGFDAFVSTACPRIAIDDGELYERPVLTPPEFLSAIGARPLAPYLFDTYV